MKVTCIENRDSTKRGDLIHCPICDKRWYHIEGDLCECRHLEFVLSTFDDLEFIYKKESLPQKFIEDIFKFYEDFLNLDDEDLSIPDALYEFLTNYDDKGEVADEILFDGPVDDYPGMSYYWTLYGIKKDKYFFLKNEVEKIIL